MPYAVRLDVPTRHALRDLDNGAIEEREVRVTVQQVLADHLRPMSPGNIFWPDIDLNLRNAALIDFDLSECHISNARFEYATFVGDVQFVNATVHGPCRFNSARCTGTAWFSGSIFEKNASFTEMRFCGDAKFDDVQCAGTAWFTGATFVGEVQIDGATFAHELIGFLPGADTHRAGER